MSLFGPRGVTTDREGLDIVEGRLQRRGTSATTHRSSRDCSLTAGIPSSGVFRVSSQRPKVLAYRWHDRAAAGTRFRFPCVGCHFGE